jgi:RHS repeat-associated protein
VSAQANAQGNAFTGQVSYVSDDATDLGSSGFGLMFYNARWYDPSLGRMAQADTIVPGGVQGLDRYAYVNNSPIMYTDPSGHCIDGITTIACIIAVGAVVLKVIDYGWTAWDIYQSSQVLANPNAPRGDKVLAGLNVSLAVVFEGAEPDDLLLVGLPLDDGARKLLMKGAKEAYEAGGETALIKFIKQNLGDYADDVLKKMGLGTDPSKVYVPTSKTQQVAKRGWTLTDIQEVVANPAYTRSNPNIVNRANGNPVTYYYRSDGYYVVIDDVTGQVVQVADTINPNWIDEMTNRPIHGLIEE